MGPGAADHPVEPLRALVEPDPRRMSDGSPVGGLPGAGEMGRQAGGLLGVPQVLLPLGGIGGLDPGSVVGPGT